MTQQPIRFDDGAAYERGMGGWSRLAGDVFLDWLAPAPGLNWVDVGCGNGAFTELLMQRCAPAGAQGIDPSEGQLSFARTRPGARGAVFQQGDAMALPFPDNSFDAATMALVIFFVPDPDKGVAEMVRVVRPGGLIAAYAWDIQGGGFPWEPVLAEIRAWGKTPAMPPSVGAADLAALRKRWQDGGLQQVETRTITVQRSFADFEEFWAAAIGGSVRPFLDALPAEDAARFKEGVRARLPAPDAAGRITYSARANAVRGNMPA